MTELSTDMKAKIQALKKNMIQAAQQSSHPLHSVKPLNFSATDVFDRSKRNQGGFDHHDNDMWYNGPPPHH